MTRIKKENGTAEVAEVPTLKYTPVCIKKITSEGFIAYAEAVIQGRALPDIRDGLKPVHRRTLFAQHILGNHSSKPYKKSARVVGDVIGKYHPHGDSAVYEALARMTQNWSMGAPLADGQGNFGSRDGDNAAAMRYTEVRMTKIAESMLNDINFDTVNYVNNYDGSETMPSVFPTRFPNLLINGGEGIAVGMASDIPTHNPIEVMNCVIAMTEAEKHGEKCSIEQLQKILPAPDFPTGGLLHGLESFRDAWEHGRCKFKIRCVWHEETISNHRSIVITELPYGTNKAKLIQKIAKVGREDEDGNYEIAGIFDVNDESNSEDGIRVVVELKNGYEPEIVFNELCKKTNVEIGFSYNMTVIKDNRPKTVGIYEALESFIEFREEVILRRSKYKLGQKSKRMHTLLGLMKAINKLDETIETIRNSTSPSEANKALQELLGVDEGQAADILSMRLQNLASTQLNDVKGEHDKVSAQIEELTAIIEDRIKRLDILIQESEEQIDSFLAYKDTQSKKKIFTNRRSKWQEELINICREDLVVREDCSVIMSNEGFLRRVPNSEIGTQRRGTKGKSQMLLAKKDYIAQLTSCHSHDTLAFITNKGLVSFVKAFDIETAEKGTHVNNFLKLEEDERVIIFKKISEEMMEQADEINVVIGTANGLIKRTKLSAYNTKRKVSVYTVKFDPESPDEVVFFGLGKDDAEVCITSTNNKMIRFSVSNIREVSRHSKGVKAMTLEEGARIQCGAIVAEEDIEKANIGCVSKHGILKISKITSYRSQRRGGKGIISMNLEDGDDILSSFIFNDDEEKDVVTTTRKGIVNRIDINQFRITNRRTKGSRLVSFDLKKDQLISVQLANKDDVASEMQEE